MEQLTTIFVSLIGFASAVVVVALPLWWRDRKKINELQVENKRLKVDYEVSLSLSDANTLNDAIENVFSKTKIDRFVMFQGENGGGNPLKFTSAILEKHKKNLYFMLSVGARNKYIGVEFDNDYGNYLKVIEGTKKGLFLDVQEMPRNDLKGFYIEENVKHSSIWFQSRYKMNTIKDIVLYYSFATHNEEALTDEEKNILQIAMYQINNLKFIIRECS